jgi:O-antigen ligase
MIDYTSLFLYATDISLLLVLFLYGISDIIRAVRHEIGLLFFLLFVLLSYFVSFHPEISVIFAGRIIFLSLFAVVLKRLYETKEISLTEIFVPIFLSACLQSCIGIFQFFTQKSIGLQILGEPFVQDIFLPEIAKAYVAGEKVLRVFGTLPHANVFAAECVLGIISGCVLFFKINKKTIYNIFLFLGIVVLWLGILFSFSRSGLIAGLFSCLLFLLYGIFAHETRVRSFALLGGFLIFFLCVYMFFSPILLSRKTFSREEPSVDHRLVYNEIGASIALSRPLGVGVGNHGLYALSEGLYEKNNLTLSWLAQPVHNIFIITFAETGILGGIAFLVFLASFFWSFLRRGVRFLKPYIFEVFLFISLMFFVLWFGMLDHFFWDIQQGMLMFWMSIGIMMAIRPQGPRNTTENI